MQNNNSAIKKQLVGFIGLPLMYIFQIDQYLKPQQNNNKTAFFSGTQIKILDHPFCFIFIFFFVFRQQLKLIFRYSCSLWLVTCCGCQRWKKKRLKNANTIERFVSSIAKMNYLKHCSLFHTTYIQFTVIQDVSTAPLKKYGYTRK